MNLKVIRLNQNYENAPMQYNTDFFLVVKCFQLNNLMIFFLIFAQNLDYNGYSLESPRRGGSNVYPQSMLGALKNKKNIKIFITENFHF